jgi:hypothetical protein
VPRDFAALRRDLVQEILATDQTRQTTLARAMRLLDPVFKAHRRNARALRAVLIVADRLTDAARPLPHDDAAQELVNQARVAAAQLIREAVATELGMTTEQLREFQYSVGY